MTVSGQVTVLNAPIEIQPDGISLAEFLIGIVEQLHHMTSSRSLEEGLKRVTVREITFLVPYDPGEEGSPLPLPLSRDGIPVLGFSQARSYLLARDRRVALAIDRVSEAPQERVAVLNLTIRIS